MPVYRITVLLKNGKGATELRHYEEDIDMVYSAIDNKVYIKYTERLEKFDCVMISRQSQEYKEFIAKNGFRTETLHIPTTDPFGHSERKRPRR